MRRRRVADIGHWRAACAHRWRHAPAHHGQLGPAAGVADHRGRVVGKHARHRRQIADVTVDDAEQRDDRGLVGCDGIEIADDRLL